MNDIPSGFNLCVRGINIFEDGNVPYLLISMKYSKYFWCFTWRILNSKSAVCIAVCPPGLWSSLGILGNEMEHFCKIIGQLLDLRIVEQGTTMLLEDLAFILYQHFQRPPYLPFLI